MLDEYKQLDEKHKFLLNILAIFGDEKTEISVIIEFFFVKEEFDELYEIFFDLNEKAWIELEQNKYVLKSKAEEFIFNKVPPSPQNSIIVIESFKSILLPPFNDKLNIQIEKLLLKTFSRLIGYSKDLALLYDYYGQYLSSIDNNETAVYFYNLAIECYEHLNISDVQLCNFYNHLSDSYLRLDEKEKSLNEAFKATHIAYSLPPKDIIVLVYSFTIISNIYFKQKKYNLAYEYNIKLLDIAQKNINDSNLLSHLYFEASFSAFKNKMIKESSNFLDKSLGYANKISLQEKDQELIDKIKLQKQYMNLVKKFDIIFDKFASWKMVLILLIIIIIGFFVTYYFY